MTLAPELIIHADSHLTEPPDATAAGSVGDVSGA